MLLSYEGKDNYFHSIYHHDTEKKNMQRKWSVFENILKVVYFLVWLSKRRIYYFIFLEFSAPFLCKFLGGLNSWMEMEKIGKNMSW